MTLYFVFIGHEHTCSRAHLYSHVTLFSFAEKQFFLISKTNGHEHTVKTSCDTFLEASAIQLSYIFVDHDRESCFHECVVYKEIIYNYSHNTIRVHL